MYFGFFILSLALIAGCNSDNVKSIVQGNDEFTVKTYKELLKISADNFVFSGLSAETVLALLANGAKGETRSQLLKGLSLPENLDSTNNGYKELLPSLNIDKESLKLSSANRIYPAKGFSITEAFNNTAVNVYESGVQNLDYTNQQAAASTINQWVEEKTNNKIKNLIDPNKLSSSTVLVLVNALYFSGEWTDHFDYVSKGPFFTSATASKEVDFMRTETWAKYSHDDNLKATFLEMDFIYGNVSMTFVLPDSRTGLTATENNLQEYLKPKKMEYARVAVTIPKFKIETTIDFKPILQSFGIEKIFTNGDLSGISSEGPLKVDFVVQKAFIDCNQKGVEAAAATAVGVVGYSLIERPIKYNFKADHPFFFYIREKHYGTTLFVGRFNK
ncbi:antichymotrypsin-2-like isoform X2 [Diorhabda carinulata]|uniref:antichymotrypsin-2-like isoform X2 n=1 Tax=Diorhabda carinulata TaxID=1163345 RepID=UPI0025A2802D|nr:antichymotrypsin-2-like isoform X2 [Diorhabda carinulata]